VVEELGKDAREMALASNDQKIEAFPACGLDQALDERIRTRAPIGSKRYFGALSSEDGVELGGELGVAVVDDRADWELQVWGSESPSSSMQDLTTANGAAHYNGERPHRSGRLRPPAPRGDPIGGPSATIRRRARLGGAIE
jgi:hypothetical protein